MFEEIQIGLSRYIHMDDGREIRKAISEPSFAFSKQVKLTFVCVESDANVVHVWLRSKEVDYPIGAAVDDVASSARLAVRERELHGPFSSSAFQSCAIFHLFDPGGIQLVDAGGYLDHF